MDPMDRVRAFEQAAADAVAQVEADSKARQEAQVGQLEADGWTDAAARAKAQLAEGEVEEAEVEPDEDSTDVGTGNYEDRTRVQLVTLARQKGVKGAAQMRKDELIDELREG